MERNYKWRERDGERGRENGCEERGKRRREIVGERGRVSERGTGSERGRESYARGCWTLYDCLQLVESHA